MYFDEERTNDKDKSPMGFFPHQHDPVSGVGASTQGGFQVLNASARGHVKPTEHIHDASRDVFKIYFDEFPTGAHAGGQASMSV